MDDSASKVASGDSYRTFTPIGDDLKKSERFGQRKGGQRLLFGLHLFAWGNPDTLVLCEGEFNCMSLFEVSCGDNPFHVASWGSRDNIKSSQVVSLIRKVAQNYRRVIVWADEPDRAVSAMGTVENRNVIALKSPRGKDANDLLQEGVLEQFMLRLLKRHG